ncbi:N-fatty-acyl-amino acid synthase/hydrolase PM20D1.2 [Latimeria chalumnae]|uniref:Peptidase M20 domain containing 1 n=1 Tax=Latimeria chalumnae TaxID=7897 RepID=H3B488_LATCH|nr:PREDICTED: probable carboxypeptidase PM20D1 [Latimeria chalumnae]|eukprot:XP_006000451.1 PREDICTED: probable carboxypeptidase PM20D1 [Latimeria chalumnae]
MVRYRLAQLLKGVCGSLFVAVLLLLGVVLLRTYTFNAGEELFPDSWEKREQLPVELTQQEKAELKENLKAAIRIPTVSFTPTELNTTAMEEFTKLIRKAFPSVFSSSLVQHEIIAGYSHLFTVQGSDPSLQPYILCAHLDVVPANEDEWEAPPFSAQEIDGYIYGRGTIDDKQSVMGILTALEFLLRRGYKPHRPFYIGIGHDEEVLGYNGAKNIAAKLESRGVTLSFLLDEGMAILDGVIQGLKKPIAIVGASEKGSATLTLGVKGESGHSSMPPKETSIGILSAAVSRLEENLMPSKFGEGPERGTFEQLASQFVFPLNVIMTNLWLFSSLVSRVLEKGATTNAIVRTTTAVTMFNAGVKCNVIPSYAEAVVNFRIHPAQTVQEVLRLAKDIIADERIQIHVNVSFDPLPISSYGADSFGYQIIKKTMQESFPQIPVVPGMCIGNTDTRHYLKLTSSLYRFVPIWFKPGDQTRIHGKNERISITNYEEIVGFYFLLIQNADIGKLPSPHTNLHEL